MKQYRCAACQRPFPINALSGGASAEVFCRHCKATTQVFSDRPSELLSAQ